MNERITILGGGESGVGAAILAQKKGYEVFLSDGGDITEVRKEQLRENNIHFEEGQHTQDKILNSNLVVKSPGIPDSADIVKRILAQKIQVISEIEWAY
jgi:UDP-N-acetylmuramoylalanine--D-glutamate ligase